MVIVIIRGDAHDLAPEFAEDCALFGFGVYVSPHLVHWAVCQHNFALINLILHVEILDFDVFCFVLLALPFVSRRIALVLSW
jgi:hypothetical protein